MTRSKRKKRNQCTDQSIKKYIDDVINVCRNDWWLYQIIVSGHFFLAKYALSAEVWVYFRFGSQAGHVYNIQRVSTSIFKYNISDLIKTKQLVFCTNFPFLWHRLQTSRKNLPERTQKPKNGRTCSYKSAADCISQNRPPTKRERSFSWLKQSCRIWINWN